MLQWWNIYRILSHLHDDVYIKINFKIVIVFQKTLPHYNLIDKKRKTNGLVYIKSTRIDYITHTPKSQRPPLTKFSLTSADQTGNCKLSPDRYITNVTEVMSVSQQVATPDLVTGRRRGRCGTICPEPGYASLPERTDSSSCVFLVVCSNATFQE